MDEAVPNSASDAHPLPPDLSACHALLVEQARALIELQDERTRLSQEVEELKLAMTKLLLQLQGHRRERVVVDPNQLPLDFGDDPAGNDALAAAAAEAQKIFIEYTVRRELKKKNKPPRDEKFPEHLERREIVLNVPDEQKECAQHGPKVLIGYWGCTGRHFNGATANSPWMTVRLARLAIDQQRLQWGHGEFAVDDDGILRAA